MLRKSRLNCVEEVEAQLCWMTLMTCRSFVWSSLATHRQTHDIQISLDTRIHRWSRHGVQSKAHVGICTSSVMGCFGLFSCRGDGEG